MGRQWNQIIESLGPLTGGTMSINANLADIEALLTTLQADVADGITVSSGTVTANGRSDVYDPANDVYWNKSVIAFGNPFIEEPTLIGPLNPLPISGTVTANVGIASESDVTQFGEWIANGFNAVQPTIAVIGTSGGQPFPISGTVTANPTYATSGGTGPTTFTSTSYGTIAASNSNRKGLTVFNEGAGNLHITIGTATTSTSSYTIRISSGDYYELPYNYTGLIGGIFATAGTARVTEIV